MDNELDYIISAYASLKLSGAGLSIDSPLKSVSTNHSPSKLSKISPHKRSSIIIRSSPSEISKICWSAIELGLSKMPKNQECRSLIRLISSAFSQLYKIEEGDSKERLVKKHQTCIARFIEIESQLGSLEFKASLNEIKSLYLNTGDSERIHLDPYDILRMECPIMLKFFVLQILLKKFQQKIFEHEDLVLSFFHNCTSYPTLTEAQKCSLIKLALSFTKCTSSIQFKQCLNLKFLQLLDQFDLKFKDFISNMTQVEFLNETESSIYALSDVGQIPFFLFEYSMNDNSQSMMKLIEHFSSSLAANSTYGSIQWRLVKSDSASSKNLLKLLQIPNVTRSLLCSELSHVGRPNAAVMQGLGEFIVRNLTNPDQGLGVIVNFYINNVRQLNKSALETLDKFVVHSKNFLQYPEVILTVFNKLETLFIRHDQFKRLKNITNLYYNFSLKITQKPIIHQFLLNCLQIEANMLIVSPKDSDLRIKLEKSTRVLLSQNIPTKNAFSIVFNNDFLSRLPYSNLVQKIDIITETLGTKMLFQDLSQLPVVSLSEENRAIIFVLAARYTNSRLEPFLEKLNIQSPLLRMLCGIYYQDIPLVKPTSTKQQVSKGSDASPLVRSFYYLVQEVRTNSTNNIKKIQHLYKTAWVNRNKGHLTSFEFQFLVKLVDYLKFINFQKLLREVITSIECYRSEGDRKFNDWLSYCDLENRIMLRKSPRALLNEIDIQSYRTDFGVTVDNVLNTLKYQLLKLKYHLYNYDEERLIQTASDIFQAIEQHTDVLSIANKNGYSKEKFSDVIVLLVKLHLHRAKAVTVLGDHFEGISSASIAVQLSKSVLKQDFDNLEVVCLISSAFRNLIKGLIHLGVSKDADYYVEELKKLNESIMRFRSIYTLNCYFLCYYQFITGNISECDELKIRANTIFSHLRLIEDEGYLDNFKLIYYSLISNVYAQPEDSAHQTKQNLKRFFAYMDKEAITLSSEWKQYYEYVFNEEVSVKHTQNPFIRSMDLMTQSRKLFIDAQNYLNIDPLFSTLEDSAMSIPSTYKEEDLPVSPPKNKIKNLKNVKRSILNLKHSKNLILDLFRELRYLSNYHIDEINKVLSLDLLTLSSISNSYKNESITESFKLNDYTKNQPLVNEKALVTVSSKTTILLPNFNFDTLSFTANHTDGTLDDNSLKRLPEDWQVVTIDVCSFNGDLIISKFQKELESPNVLRLPLSRHSSRTVDEESFSLADATHELKSIIGQSDATLAKERTEAIKTIEDRKAWHEERRDLDGKLKSLLTKIEYCWLGGFKGIFNQDVIPAEQLKQFKERFLVIIRQNIPSRSQRNPSNNPVEIDDFVIELFLKIGDPSKLMSTELLEDLIYFVLDILSFHGEENAYDEIDIDDIYVQVEDLINEYLIANPLPQKKKHTVLIVGKECQPIPWESLPCLRDTSTTRMPSFTFLLKLYEQNKRLIVNKRNGSYLVNPSGDLVRSQERFEGHFNRLTQTLNWVGISCQKPKESEVEEFLTNSNIFVYIGHGGGEQYIRSTTLKKLNKIAPTLLLGCSSAALKDRNLLEPSGTIYSYLLGGCPMVLGNLWDVTDKDIDMFSQSVFAKWGLVGEEKKGTDICDAVRQSRSVCNLKYLNGAAPVVYGLPLSLL